MKSTATVFYISLVSGNLAVLVNGTFVVVEILLHKVILKIKIMSQETGKLHMIFV